MVNNGKQGRTDKYNCDEGWMKRKERCVVRRTSTESAEGENEEEKERTLPAAAVGGPDGEMRKG